MNAIEIRANASLQPMLKRRQYLLQEAARFTQKIDALRADGRRETVRDSDRLSVLALFGRAKVIDNFGIPNVGELCKMREQDLLKYRNFGPNCLEALKLRLKCCGRKLSG